MGSTPARVLLDVHSETQFRELGRVARLAAASGRYTCTFSHTDASDHVIARVGEECARDGFAVVPFAPRGLHAHVPRWLPLPGRAYQTAYAIADARSRLACARALLDETRPSLIVMGEDGMGANRALVRVAGQRSIPIVIVPYEYSTGTQPAIALMDMSNYRRDYGMETRLNRLVARRYPHWVSVHAGERLLRATAPRIVAEEVMGLAPPRPWTVHGGRADKLAAECSVMIEHYLREGVPREKIALTGALYHDELRRALDARSATRAALAAEFGLDPRRRMIACALPPSYVSRAGCDFASYRALLEFWIGAMLRSDAAVVFQLHPAITPEQEREIAALGAKVSRADIATLIAACDALVTSASSIIRMAIACGRPVLNYDVYRFGYHDYDGAGGVLTVQEQRDFLRLVSSFAANDEVAVEAAAKQAACAPAWGVLDGGAGARMLALFDELGGRP